MQHATISMQVFEFVDDVQIACPSGFEGGLTKVDFQMKDRGSLSWGEMENDFEYQLRLNQSNDNVNSNQIVVVSRKTVAEKLKSNIPKSIEKHSAVELFPNDVPNKLLMGNVEVLKAIQEICAFPEETDKLEHVYILIIAVLVNQPDDSRMLIKDILAQAKILNPLGLMALGGSKGRS